MKVPTSAFKHEKVLVGTFSVIVMLSRNVVGCVQDSVRLLQEAGVRCLALLALLLPRDVARLFPRMRPQQRRLLAICCARLDPRPPYQVLLSAT